MSTTNPIDSTTRFPLSKIRKYRPDLAHISPQTWHRWTQKPVRGHQLAAVRIGWQFFVTLEAVDQFIAALNAGSSDATPAVRSPDERASPRRPGGALNSMPPGAEHHHREDAPRGDPQRQEPDPYTHRTPIMSRKLSFHEKIALVEKRNAEHAAALQDGGSSPRLSPWRTLFRRLIIREPDKIHSFSRVQSRGLGYFTRSSSTAGWRLSQGAGATTRLLQTWGGRR